MSLLGEISKNSSFRHCSCFDAGKIWPIYVTKIMPVNEFWPKKGSCIHLRVVADFGLETGGLDLQGANFWITGSSLRLRDSCTRSTTRNFTIVAGSHGGNLTNSRNSGLDEDHESFWPW